MPFPQLTPLPPLAGRRVLITGAARGIGAALARRLHGSGARVAVAGLEPEPLAAVAADCDGPWWTCDVADRAQVEAAVSGAAGELGGLDVVVANAGVTAQMPISGGDPEVMERTLRVNALGTYYTLRATAPHLSHPRGYALAVSSVAAAVHPPLLGAYSASKAAVEALGNTLRAEMMPYGARVGVAYFAELETDMTRRGLNTEAMDRFARSQKGAGAASRVSPLKVGIDALERGIARRSRRVVAPWWVAAVLPARMLVQPLMDRALRSGLDEVLEIARAERAPLTTEQPSRR